MSRPFSQWLSRALPILLALSFIGYFGFKQMMAQKGRQSGSSIKARGATGLSLYKKYLEELKLDHLVKKTSFAENFDWSSYDSLLIVDPFLPIDENEAKIMAREIRQGKKALISFHTTAGRVYLAPLLDELGLKLNLTAMPGFQNEQLIPIKEGRGRYNRQVGDSYFFYSHLVFDEGSCAKSPHYLTCFTSKKKVDQGEVLIVLGLSPISNALLGKGENSELAIQWTNWLGRPVIDEYHHFYASAGLSGLFSHFPFVVFLIIVLLGTLAYFLFGDEPEETAPLSQRSSSRSIPTFHGFNQSVLSSVMQSTGRYSEGLEAQLKYLRRCYPEAAEDWKNYDRMIQSKKIGEKDLRLFQNMLSAHRKNLVRRGRKLK